ncbi:hypothetical protein ACFXGA_28210 [Actinosynnema sp. NPDC059335]|uniref:hypothetical protein n=1 Tax=Actinosynnema sp. NPDC059335 TaxID=3346804 RepID=UPI00367189FB
MSDDWFLNYAHRHEMTPGYSPDDDVPDPYLPGDAVPAREPKSRGGSQRAARPAPVGGGSLPAADRGGPWEVVARRWLTRNPRRSNRECLRALREAGHRGGSTKLIQRIRDGLPKGVRARSVPPAGAKAGAAGKARADGPRSTGSQRGASQPVKPSPGTRRDAVSRRHRARARPAWHDVALRWLAAHPGASNNEWLEAIAEQGCVGVTKSDLTALRREIGPVRRAQRPGRPVAPARVPEQPGHRYCDGCGMALDLDGRCRC